MIKDPRAGGRVSAKDGGLPRTPDPSPETTGTPGGAREPRASAAEEMPHRLHHLAVAQQVRRKIVWAWQDTDADTVAAGRGVIRPVTPDVLETWTRRASANRPVWRGPPTAKDREDWRARPRRSPERLSALDGWRAVWVAWLATFRWDFFATGIWAHPHTPEAAWAALHAWFARLPPQAYAVVGLQAGLLAHQLHLHLLLGGLGQSVASATALRGAWPASGHLQVDPYHPRLGGIAYLVHQADELEMLGDPQPFRSRHRGGVGRRLTPG